MWFFVWLWSNWQNFNIARRAVLWKLSFLSSVVNTICNHIIWNTQWVLQRTILFCAYYFTNVFSYVKIVGNVDCCLCHTRRQDVYCSYYWKLCSATISTSQHLNASFQNSYSQFALPCEFLDCWTRNAVTAKLCPGWMPFSLPAITGYNIMTTNLT